MCDIVSLESEGWGGGCCMCDIVSLESEGWGGFAVCVIFGIIIIFCLYMYH